MKQITFLLFGLFLALESCAVNDTSSSGQATVQNSFFPLDNGLLYTYGRFGNNRYDTITCRIVIGKTAAYNNVLLDTANSQLLYYIDFTHDANGNLAATLSNDTMTLMALDGNLQTGATWVADDVHGIQATVVGQYDDYYLPGRTTQYSNVLAVKYHQDGQPDNCYTLRFFAQGNGLILERQLVGPNTEIASLQLISIQYPPQ
jgi:hypothetical protein